MKSSRTRRAQMISAFEDHWNGIYIRTACTGGEWSTTHADSGQLLLAVSLTDLKEQAREHFARSRNPYGNSST